MNQLGIIRAGIISPGVESLRSSGSNVALFVAKAKLPARINEHQQGLIPWFSAIRFLEIVTRYTGDPLFSANTLQSEDWEPANRVASLSLYDAPTTYESIRTFVERANAATTGATIKTSVSGGWMWILRKPHHPGVTESWQVEQFVIATMVKAISFILGQDWQPEKLEIRVPELPTAIPDQWKSAEIVTASSHTAIGIRMLDIVSATKSDTEYTEPPVHSPQTGLRGSVQDDPDNLRLAVQHYIARETPSMMYVADAFGVNVRTFRRHMVAANISYRDLVDKTRYKRALKLINDTSIPITEIAFSLGYEFPENFTRAFRKQTGVSPSEYRKMKAVGT